MDKGRDGNQPSPSTEGQRPVILRGPEHDRAVERYNERLKREHDNPSTD